MGLVKLVPPFLREGQSASGSITICRECLCTATMAVRKHFTLKGKLLNE